MKTPREIRARFPYMFDGPNIGITIHRGWIELFANVCVEVDVILYTDKRGFHWTQVKEKFGMARWYWTMDVDPSETSVRQAVKFSEFNPDGTVTRLNPDDQKLTLTSIVDRIDAAIEAGQALTHAACICCGAPGQNDEFNGLYLVMCSEHKRERSRVGQTPSIAYFNEEEK
jgi:hypothetical protein